MTKLSKNKKISVRIDRYNYEMIRAVADVFFRDKDEVEGNFSKALDYLLSYLRIKSEMSPHIRHWIYKFRYDCGFRDKETIEGMKRYEAHLLKVSNQ